MLNHGITHNSLARARAWAAASAISSRTTCFPGGELTHVAPRDRGHGGSRASSPSTPKRCASITRRRCGTGSTGSRRTRTRRAREVGDERYRDLAHLHGGLGARVRPRLAVAVAGAGRQAAAGRPPAASADARLHVRRAEPGAEQGRASGVAIDRQAARVATGTLARILAGSPGPARPWPGRRPP